MVTVTDVGFLPSKEQLKKENPFLESALKVSVSQGHHLSRERFTQIYLCIVMVFVDTTTVISGGCNLGIGGTNSFSFRRGNSSCSQQEAAETNHQCWKQTSGFYCVSWQTCLSSSFIFPHILITSPFTIISDLTLAPYFYLNKIILLYSLHMPSFTKSSLCICILLTVLVVSRISTK